jgi:hypothetical protein
VAIRQSRVSAKDLSAKIDEIDDKIHDLLLRRARLGVAAFAPARQAVILRRFAGRHQGTLPLTAVLRIWRELFAAAPSACRAVHVYDGEQAGFFRDVARDQFGSTATLSSHATVGAVVHACADDPSSCGVVPPPQSEDEARAWWTQLCPAGQIGPRVAAKLPFAAGLSPDQPWAYAIATVEFEPTGDDTSLLLLEADAGLSRGKLQTLLKQAGLETHLLAVSGGASTSPLRQHLLETQGFVAGDDARLALLLETAGGAVLRAAQVGGFANPLQPARSKP